MDVREAVFWRRSVRSFEPREIEPGVLDELIDAARVGPAAANRQPLEYVVVSEPALREEVFACLKWAAYIAPAGDPPEGHHPAAYIVVLRRKDYEIEAMAGYDVGAAVQTILLMAASHGLGTCWLKAVNFPKVCKLVDVPDGLTADCVIALGYPQEHPKRVDLETGQDGLEAIKYWRDKSGQHFVPKRNLALVLHHQRYGG